MAVTRQVSRLARRAARALTRLWHTGLVVLVPWPPSGQAPDPDAPP